MVVALAVRDSLLAMPSVSECPADAADVPVLILDLLQDLDPHVRNGHSEPVVEAHTTKGKGQAQSGHAGHVLSDGDAFGVQLVEHLVGDHEVYNSFLVYCSAKILVIAAREASGDVVSKRSGDMGMDDLRPNPVVDIEHAGDAVEAETVKMVLFHPKAEVTEQEPQNLVAPVVEQPAVP